MKMKFAISHLTIDMYDQVITLWEQCEGIGLSDADSRENIRLYLERNPDMSFVAQDDGLIVGAVMCGHDGRRGYFYHLAVRPDYRRRGIGRKLIDRCLSALRSVSIQKCHIFIFNDNADGVQFWKDIGWTYRTDISVMSKDIERDGV